MNILYLCNQQVDKPCSMSKSCQVDCRHTLTPKSAMHPEAVRIAEEFFKYFEPIYYGNSLVFEEKEKENE